jgi:hypothetical protein
MMALNNNNFLTATANGGSGIDTLKITDLTGGTLVNLNDMIGRISGTEIINIKDGISELISVSSAAIQSIVGQDTSSILNIQLDGNDSIVVQASHFYTTNASGSTYTFYNSDPTLGGATQIAQIDVSTV